MQVMQYKQQVFPLQKAVAATTSADSREDVSARAKCAFVLFRKSRNMGRLQIVKDATRSWSTPKNHGTQRRERLMTEMKHDERLVRRVQAVDDRKRRLPNAEGKRDAVRPRSMQQDDVENNQSSEEPGIDRNRDQSGSGVTQLEGHAVQALAQGSDLLRQCCNETQTQELGVPMIGCQQSHGHEQYQVS